MLHHEAAVLFSYDERHPEIALRNWQLLAADNWNTPIIPLTCGPTRVIPGTVDVEPLPNPWVTEEEFTVAPGQSRRAYWLWATADRTICYRYLRYHPWAVKAQRYILLDWDTFSNRMPLEAFYGDAWDADGVAIHLVTPASDPHWQGWPVPKEQFADHPYLRGGVPCCGMLLSRDAAMHLCNTSAPPPLRTALSEVYTPSVLTQAGTKVVSLEHRVPMIGVYGTAHGAGPRPGIYHPVSHITPWH